MALRDQVAPPTASFTEVDPQCGLDPVPGAGRPMVLDVALSNNFGFAGANASIAFARPGNLGAPAPAVGPDEVVVTGFGVITSAGEGAEALWDAYAAGHRQGEPEDGLRLARVEFDRTAAGSPRERRRMDKVSQLAVVASRVALGAAGADGDPDAVAATGVVLGTGIGPMESSERFTVPGAVRGRAGREPGRLPEHRVQRRGRPGRHGPGRPRGRRRPSRRDTRRAPRPWGSRTTCCAPGAPSACWCRRWRRSRRPRWRRTAASRCSARTPGADTRSPRSASRWCWSAGTVAERRGATIHAVVQGYATASDACGIGRWDPSGDGIERAMRGALRSAGLEPEHISAVWANAAGLPTVDRPERAAVERVFDKAPVRIETPKRVLGEPVGAGAHLSALLAIGAWREAGTHGPVLLNSSSLGGTHTSLVLSPAPSHGTESS